MSTTLDQVTAQAQLLSLDDRATLAEILLDSLDEPNTHLDKLWNEELRRRLEAHERGELPSVDYEEFMAQYR